MGNSKSPIPLIYMFIYTWQRPFALPEFVSNLYFNNYHVLEMNQLTNLTDIWVKQNASDLYTYTWRTKVWDLIILARNDAISATSGHFDL